MGVEQKPAAADWWLLPAFVIAVAVAYRPAWFGGLLWDDPAHITRFDLQSAAGLWRIWTDPGATQQYYPLTHTVFWLQYQLWSDNTFGYHLVNIALHATSAFLIVVLVRRLAVPGALLAGAIFALHPLHVESVAWISELKNTLSTVLYLTAALVYLRFDQSRARKYYALALMLFIAALLAKTVTATLPAALLVVFWWRWGRLQWAHDVRPLIPFFSLAVAAGLFTSWVERHLIGAQGAEFDLNIFERVLLAARAIWFYAGKLLLPINLSFIYPRWDVSAVAWWHIAMLIAVIGGIVMLWLERHRSRAPLAVFLLFCGSLFPALGFVNVFPFRYSFVADHFAYLASIPAIIGVAALLAKLAARMNVQQRAAHMLLTVFILLPLALLTWKQSRHYESAQTLYAATLQENPAAWLAHNNLGIIRAEQGRLLEAKRHFSEAVRLNGRIAEHHMNLGRLLIAQDSLHEGLSHLQAALQIEPGLANAHNNAGVAWLRLGRLDEAEASFRSAVQYEPSHTEARTNLSAISYERGVRSAQAGRLEEAIAHFESALGWGVANPELAAVTYYNLGVALLELNRRDEAVAALEQAVRIAPAFAEAERALMRLR